MRGVLKVVLTWVGGVGLLVAFQMFQQWQLDLDVTLTPYEIALVLAVFAAVTLWGWIPRAPREPKSIAEDTGEWHFGRNAPILAVGVVALLVVLAVLTAVLPELDPVIVTTVSRSVAIPLAVVGVGSLGLDTYRSRRQRSALDDNPRAL